LEDFLEDFQGCLIIVTHDRYFMDKLVDHLFVFEGDGIVKDYLGKYSDYRDNLKEKQLLEKQASKSTEQKALITTQKKEDTKAKLSYKEKIEFQQIEKELEELEVEKKNLMLELTSMQADHNEIIRITNKIGEVGSLIDNKTERWLVLSELEF